MDACQSGRPHLANLPLRHILCKKRGRRMRQPMKVTRGYRSLEGFARTPTPPDEPKGKDRLGSISGAIAVVAAAIAAGQAASALIQGYWQNRLEAKKQKYELQVKPIQDNAALSEGYLKLIADKDASDSDKMMLLRALTQLDGHPLQKWAQAVIAERSAARQATAVEYKIYLEAVISSSSDLEKLQAQFKVLQSEERENADNPTELEKLRKQETDIAQQIALAQGRRSDSFVSASVAVQPAGAGVGLGFSTEDYRRTDLVTVQLVQAALPTTPAENIQKYLPFLLAALKEFKLVEPEMISYTLAETSVQTEAFIPLAEMGSRFNSANAPFDKYEPDTPLGRSLGNTQVGDGARFKGRGFAQITGRANYVRMSQILGLGTLLTDNPDYANDPTIASRVLCAVVAERKPKILAALKANDPAAAHRVLVGAPGQVRFQAIYTQLYAEIVKLN
jgi:hypothetical protein